MKVPAGTSCAIVGTSGSGKSTLMRLLFRMYDRNGGKIMINHSDVNEVDPVKLFLQKSDISMFQFLHGQICAKKFYK